MQFIFKIAKYSVILFYSLLTIYFLFTSFQNTNMLFLFFIFIFITYGIFINNDITTSIASLFYLYLTQFYREEFYLFRDDKILLFYYGEGSNIQVYEFIIYYLLFCSVLLLDRDRKIKGED